MTSMPVNYLQSLRLSFSNGRIWEINIQEQLSDNSDDMVAEKLVEIFREYENDIVKIDFAVDVSRLKKDITTQTRGLM